MSITKVHGEAQLKALTVKNAQIHASAGIATSKLAEGVDIIMRAGTVPFTANVNAGSHRIVNVVAPTADTDLVNKGYLNDYDFLETAEFKRYLSAVNQFPNGTGSFFDLRGTPEPDSEEVFLNGELQVEGSSEAYVMSGAAVSFNYTPQDMDRLRVMYILNDMFYDELIVNPSPQGISGWALESDFEVQ